MVNTQRHFKRKKIAGRADRGHKMFVFNLVSEPKQSIPFSPCFLILYNQLVLLRQVCLQKYTSIQFEARLKKVLVIYLQKSFNNPVIVEMSKFVCLIF